MADLNVTKRQFIAAGAGLVVAGATGVKAEEAAPRSLAAGLAPISAEEREGRIAKVQVEMRRQGLVALLLEAGSSLVYFTGVDWWRSERFTGAVIPVDGAPVVVTPAFEEPSVRESLKIKADVRVWNEDENPFALVAGVLADRGLKAGKVGVEETVRFFIADGVAKAAPSFAVVPGAGVARACRMFKSPAELALMQAANAITLAAFREAHAHVETGMTPGDIRALISRAMAQFGGEPDDGLVLLNEASAYPHGSRQPQKVVDGGVILVDAGASLFGYKADISRSWVHGAPSKRQREVWNTVKHGQELALATMRVGVPCGHVDDVVRAYYAKKGFGPGYRLPGTPHRLGHGIGLDGHEPVNFVHGEMTPLAAGMCFSNEPGIYIPGEFGIRLEDCLHMTEKGPELFTPLAPSIDKPFG